MALVPDRVIALGLLGLTGGVAIPMGLAAHGALIVDHTTGAERRTAFAAQAILHSGAVSLGTLLGGAMIGWSGTGVVLAAAGATLLLVSVTTWTAGRRSDAAGDAGRVPGVGCARPVPGKPVEVRR